jgi:hypothetical protein
MEYPRITREYVVGFSRGQAGDGNPHLGLLFHPNDETAIEAVRRVTRAVVERVAKENHLEVTGHGSVGAGNPRPRSDPSKRGPNPFPEVGHG